MGRECRAGLLGKRRGLLARRRLGIAPQPHRRVLTLERAHADRGRPRPAVARQRRGGDVQETGRGVRVTEDRGEARESVVEPERHLGVSRGLVDDDRDHGIAVSPRVVQALQDQDDRRVAAGLAIRGQEIACGGEVDGFGREIDRADNRGVDLAGGERAPRDLERADPGELLGRHREARTGGVELSVQAIGDDVGHRAEHARRAEERHEAVPGAKSPRLVRAPLDGPLREAPARAVPRDLRIALHPDEDAGALARQRAAPEDRDAALREVPHGWPAMTSPAFAPVRPSD